MKKILILIVFLFVGILKAYTANWVEIDEKIYTDTSSIEKYNVIGRNNVYSIWTKHLNDNSDFFKDNEKHFGKKIWYFLNMSLIDCNNKEFAVKSAWAYDIKGKVIYSETENFNVEWLPIVPQSYAEALHRGVCYYTVNSNKVKETNVRVILKDARSK